MADLFISYAREDKPRAEALANALTGLGYEVFWDSEIPPGKSWADYLEGKLRQCKAMLVLWSNQSVGSQWVREEARVGRDAGKLIPVLLDNASPPFGFGEVQAANLTTWQGEAEHSDWKRLLAAIEHLTGHGAQGGASVAPQATPQATAPEAAPQQTAPGFQAQQPSQPGAGQSFASQPAAAPASGSLSFQAAVKKCLSHYADGKGRAGKAEFWWFVLFTFVVAFIAGFFDAMLFGTDFEGNVVPILTGVVSLALIAPAISVASRRLHDAGQSGWLAALMVIPYLGFIWAIVVGLMPGKPEANEHGPPVS